MPSGKQSRGKRGAQVPPPPVSGGRRASPRVLVSAAVAAAAVVVVVVVAVVLGGSSNNAIKNAPAVGSLKGALPEASYVYSLFKGIPQHGTTLGRPSAPVTMRTFIDVQCPYCQEFETQALPGLVTKYVRTGKVKVVLYPWAFIGGAGSDSFKGQAAVLAAALQNRAFDFLELLYDHQGAEDSGWLTDSLLVSIASSIPGLHVHTLFAARSSAAVKAATAAVDSTATKERIDQTPSVFVGKSGTFGALIAMTSPTDDSSVVNAINAALG